MQTTTKIEKIIRRYFLDLYASKFGNLDIMDNLLGKYKIPKLTPLDCLKRLIFKSLQNALDPEGFTGDLPNLQMPDSLNAP